VVIVINQFKEGTDMSEYLNSLKEIVGGYTTAIGVTTVGYGIGQGILGQWKLAATSLAVGLGVSAVGSLVAGNTTKGLKAIGLMPKQEP
jgi:hypothetical protein